MPRISGEKVLEVRGGLVIFDHHFRFSVPMHPNLLELDLRSLMRGVKDIVMGGVDSFGELVGGEMPAQVIGTACGHVNRA